MRNSPGFVVNRILCPMINEAIFALQEGLASAEDIDNGMRLGCNHPIGPLALADMIGLDVMLAVMNVFYTDFNDPKYRPAPLLKEMVAAGYLGRKTEARVLPLRRIGRRRANAVRAIERVPVRTGQGASMAGFPAHRHAAGGGLTGFIAQAPASHVTYPAAASFPFP